MKNYKIIYIIIIIFCVFAIGYGIYAEFFVREEDKNNIILPSFSTEHSEQTAEKTQEELNTQFLSLLTNDFLANNYDTSQIQKIDVSKEIVYTAAELSQQTEQYEVNIHLPAINIAGEVTNNFNNITQTMFADKATEIMNSQTTEKTIYSVDYMAHITGNFLSVVLKSNLKVGSKPQSVIVQTYNYNLTTGQEVKLSDLLAQKNITQSKAQNKIKKVIEQKIEEAQILVQSGYSVYNRNINDAMYQIDNASTYFLGSNGDLYIIFTYGNNNYTSEMDIVWFE